MNAMKVVSFLLLVVVGLFSITVSAIGGHGGDKTPPPSSANDLH